MSTVRSALVCAGLIAIVALACAPVVDVVAADPLPTAPTVTSIAPESGPTAGGTLVTITGTGFLEGATVTIGGGEATEVSVVSETELTAKTPAGSAGPGEVAVSDINGASSGGPFYTYEAPPPPPPMVTSIAPAFGPTAGGVSATIKGNGFVSPATVTIDGTEATEVSVISETEITAKTVATAAGSGEVVVSDENGTSIAGPTYTYVAPLLAPTVTLNAPASLSNNTMPSFTGSASDTGPVTVKLYEGATATGPVISSAEATPTGGDWTSGEASPALPSGRHTYTAVASQEESSLLENLLGESSPVTFTVDTTSPTVSLIQLVSPSNDTMPSFKGSASDTGQVTVEIYKGATATGSPVSSATATPTSGDWISGNVSPALSGGQYTAIATQESSLGNPAGASNPVMFTVDVTPPQVTLTSPAHGSSASSSSQTVSGFAGTAEGDQPAITIQLFAGSTITGPALEAITVQASKGVWSATFGGLSPGTYTAQAEQRDDVGNIGYSEPATFTLKAPAVVTPPTPTPPVATNEQPPTVTVTQPTPSPSPTVPPAQSPPAASFQWFPSAPHTGERISLVSTSTDATSPIAGFAWSLAGDGAFNAGSPAITASFAAPGNHVVQLRVTGTNGLTSVATETIPVTSPVLTLMQPFPVVRIAGSESASSVKIGLLTVQAPVGATVAVTCRGPGCPTGSEHVVAAARRSKGTAGGVVLIAFRRFERSLRAGAILEIRVSERGQIGKYTSFAVRRGRLPARVDTCLSPAGIEPIVCPSS